MAMRLIADKGKSLVSAVRVRLYDRTRAPRRWWYPPVSHQLRHKDTVRELHGKYSDTTNKSMLSLLAISLYTLLTTLNTPDKSLLEPNGTIKVPFTDASISFLAFMIVGP